MQHYTHKIFVKCKADYNVLISYEYDLPLHVGFGHLSGKSLFSQLQDLGSIHPWQLGLQPANGGGEVQVLLLAVTHFFIWGQQEPPMHWSLSRHLSHLSRDCFGVHFLVRIIYSLLPIESKGLCWKNGKLTIFCKCYLI